MPVEVGDLILVAFFSGIGAGIGNPIGNWIFRTFIEKKINNINSVVEQLRVQNLGLLKSIEQIKDELREEGKKDGNNKSKV